jgi:hypothetical protein
VHPFWLSHEEKMTLVRALHGRRPWPELELHGGARRRGKRGGARGEGGL